MTRRRFQRTHAIGAGSTALPPPRPRRPALRAEIRVVVPGKTTSFTRAQLAGAMFTPGSYPDPTFHGNERMPGGWARLGAVWHPPPLLPLPYRHGPAREGRQRANGAVGANPVRARETSNRPRSCPHRYAETQSCNQRPSAYDRAAGRFSRGRFIGRGCPVADDLESACRLTPASNSLKASPMYAARL